MRDDHETVFDERLYVSLLSPDSTLIMTPVMKERKTD